MDKIKLAIASDLSGFPLKKAVVEHLKENYADTIEVIDFGIESEDKPRPYFEQAPKVAKCVQSGEAEKGILICGTGQGMAIVSNKFKGVYASVVDSVFAAERSKIINNANIITMGGWITAPFLGTQIVDAWLSMAFTQKMEFKKDFLTNAFKEVQKLEDEIYG
ncbi:RpiB/LacA/LacB family sugar-phosphate isomerase [Spirochaeta isovalerica]|uniref:Ribose 5-phosphate isomerase B n=1 Tax=Spirochaeta isovalerica TaxID=150 RepID=A0A841RJP3_9SPIO|nr:RpiB/LacA/LacB family sugar-phosphate isomerase [Spirochaeta isovalerica]MBB6482512.1 ribose 5-phosphate isomerase B [Spirochaeta isovalerica]